MTVYEAILDRDPEAARNVVDRHLRFVQQMLHDGAAAGKRDLDPRG